MKKLASALAVAAAIAAPSLASAQSPTLYGLLHTAVEHHDNGTDTSLGVVARASHIGLRGGIPLQVGGLMAIYQLQSSVDTAEGGGTLLGQDSWVGLRSGSLGTLRIGHISAPSTVLAFRVGLFRDQIGDHRNAFRSETNFDLRVGNAIAYGNTFGPIGLDLYYVTDFDTPDYNPPAATDGDQAMYGIGLSYASGGLWVGATYERHEDAFGVTGPVNPPTVMDRTRALRDADAFRVGASYRSGPLRITGMAEVGNQYYPLTSAVFGGGKSVDHWTAGAGVAYTIGRVTLKTEAYMTEVDTDDGTDQDSTLFAVGAEFRLGASTNLYANYAVVSNGDDANRGTWSRGAITPSSLLPAPEPGDDVSGVALGIVHRF